MNANFEKLFRRNGAYNLPWLITLSDSNNTTVFRYVNDNTDITYGGSTYTASCFNYKPNAREIGFSGGGTLEISLVGNNIIDLIESNTQVKLSVVGVIRTNGTVEAIENFSHNYGKVKVQGMKATFTFEKDDRLNMTFPALIWNNYNNRGN